MAEEGLGNWIGGGAGPTPDEPLGACSRFIRKALLAIAIIYANQEIGVPKYMPIGRLAFPGLSPFAFVRRSSCPFVPFVAWW